MSDHITFLHQTLDAARINVEKGGAPRSALIVKDHQVIARAVDGIETLCDPTAHAEILALREAAKALNTTDLTGVIVYVSSEPCPMCQAALYLANAHFIYYAYSSDDLAPYGLSIDGIKEALNQDPIERDGAFRYIPEAQTQPNIFQLWREHLD